MKIYINKATAEEVYNDIYHRTNHGSVFNGVGLYIHLNNYSSNIDLNVSDFVNHMLANKMTKMITDDDIRIIKPNHISIDLDIASVDKTKENVYFSKRYLKRAKLSMFKATNSRRKLENDTDLYEVDHYIKYNDFSVELIKIESDNPNVTSSKEGYVGVYSYEYNTFSIVGRIITHHYLDEVIATSNEIDNLKFEIEQLKLKN